MPSRRSPKPRPRGGPRAPHSKVSFLVHGRFHEPSWDFSHHVVPPMTSSVTYRLSSAERGGCGFCGYADPSGRSIKRSPIYIYDRLDEPTRAMLEERLAYAENGDIALCFATGMAAISASLGVTCRMGDELVAHPTLYGCTYSLFTNWLPRQGVGVRYADCTSTAALARAIGPKTRVVYFETPVNPTLEVIDIAAVAKVVRAANQGRPKDRRILIIVDNTFATPFCQRPLDHGADIVVHSLTKNIAGFGTDMGGAVIARREWEPHLLLYRKDFGGVLSPKSAWSILVYGLPSLDIRLRKETESAFEVARFLERHEKVDRVMYPGLESFPRREVAKRQMTDFTGAFAPGNMIYFVLAGEPKVADRLSNRLVNDIAKNAYSITLAVSLGQIRTLIEKPGSMTHSALPPEVQRSVRIDPGGVRLSIGLEDPEDLIADLGRALEEI